MSRKYGSEYQHMTPEAVEQYSYVPRITKKNKGGVIGIKKRDGEIIVKGVDKPSAELISMNVQQHVAPDAHLMTDEKQNL